MLTPEQIQTRLDRILLKVTKPGRYVGGEFNMTVKDWEEARTRVALVFPDIYDIGISNLGLKILYDQVNQREDALAERAYAPWTDMEAKMREEGIPLYSLETFHPLAAFDIIAFTLPYETLYTNALNVLDLAGIPVHASQRSGDHPLIIAGGHSVMNPEPMHAFIDAFVIGEGEEVIHDIIDVVQKSKAAGASHNEMLRDLAGIPGVYVPSFYEVTYLDDGTVDSVTPTIPEALPVITKRMVAKLPPPPTRFIVPNIEVIHNRAPVEIMRGCTRGCRFCQAGMIVRPVRERSVEEVVLVAEEAIRTTGFEELALMSLSSSDYSRIIELVTAIGEKFAREHLSVSLPSLRIESVSIDLMEKLKSRRTGGFTLAPEAATERMRRIINKFIPDDDILNTTREIYSRGWLTIKLYFMIGHPSETLEDVQAIADLCKRVLAEGRKVQGMRVKLNVGVSTFVPKPQTPFQWVSCDTPDQMRVKQALLKRELHDKNIKLTWTRPEDTLLEAWLSRGDRKVSDVIYTAWRNGARFDAWNDQYHYETWLKAFEEHALDPAFYTHRQRRTDEIFPWDHISAAVKKSFLFQDFRMSLEGEIRVDCRQHCFACGILPTFTGMRRENPGDYWKCPEVKTPAKKSLASLPVLGD
jgi:radical SAM family uncharacterized protein